jgi:hypothetical protein
VLDYGSGCGPECRAIGSDRTAALAEKDEKEWRRGGVATSTR